MTSIAKLTARHDFLLTEQESLTEAMAGVEKEINSVVKEVSETKGDWGTPPIPPIPIPPLNPPLFTRYEINAGICMQRMYHTVKHPKNTRQGFDFWMNLGAYVE